MEPDPAVGHYEWLDFNSPMTSERVDRLVARLAAAGPSQVLDVGCGWAELLLRLLVACPSATGHGIDHDETLIHRAAKNARDRGVDDRVSFSAELTDHGPCDLVLNVGAEHVFGTTERALADLWDLVSPGGRLLLGTLIWEAQPTPELLEAFGELPGLDDLLAHAAEIGWRPLGLETAALDDWDEFEFGFLADWEQAVMANATGAGAADARIAADRHRESYLRRRGILGFACLTLGRPVGVGLP